MTRFVFALAENLDLPADAGDSGLLFLRHSNRPAAKKGGFDGFPDDTSIP
jgi:hypothetical protein